LAVRTWMVNVIFRYRWSASILLILMLDVSTYLAFSHMSPQTGISHEDKILHAFGFLILFIVGYLALCLDVFPRSRFPSWPLMLLNALIWSGYAFFLELGQRYLAYRQFSVDDLIADGVGMLLGLVILMLLRPQRRLARRPE